MCLIDGSGRRSLLALYEGYVGCPSLSRSSNNVLEAQYCALSTSTNLALGEIIKPSRIILFYTDVSSYLTTLQITVIDGSTLLAGYTSSFVNLPRI